MTRIKKAILFTLSTMIVMNFTACGKLNLMNKAVDPGQTKPAQQASAAPAVPKLNAADDQVMNKAISDYFIKLYSQSPDSYLENSVSGNIPESLKEFISKRTLSEGDGNIENGIHLPRIIEMNGLNLTQYEILKYGEDKPEIAVEFTAINGDLYTYFVKIGLKAKGINDTDFKAAYKENPESRTYSLQGSTLTAIESEINLLAKYNVEFVKEDNRFKIFSAREANDRPGSVWRLSKANNDFAERLPYLLLDSNVEGKVHANPEHKKIYESEVTVIEAFFSMLKGIDNNRMKLLEGAWNTSETQFLDMLKKFGLPKYEKLKDKGIEEIIQLDGEYKNKFDFYSLPVQTNIKRLIDIKNFNIIPHPGYSNTRKEYIVTFEATVEKQSGVSIQEPYKYDYSVVLAGSGNSLKVSSIKLNEAYKVEAKK